MPCPEGNVCASCGDTDVSEQFLLGDNVDTAGTVASIFEGQYRTVEDTCEGDFLLEYWCGDVPGGPVRQLNLNCSLQGKERRGGACV